MSVPDPSALPPNLPVPDDDGAADHLPGMRVPPVLLVATDGQEIVVGQHQDTTVVFCYPHLGRPGSPFPAPHWDLIPGARGCTPEACGFRDRYSEFTLRGVRVLGVSTDESDCQREAAGRLALPFPLLSDARLALARAWQLPIFEASGRVLLKRLTITLRNNTVERVWYPVFPPDRHAAEVLASL